MNACVHACMCAYLCMCVRACESVCTSVYARVCLCLRVCACARACACVAPVCTYMFVICTNYVTKFFRCTMFNAKMLRWLTFDSHFNH